MLLASPTPAQALPRPVRIDEPRFGLTFALGIAVLLHLLLLLLVAAFPEIFTSPRALLFAQEEPERPPIKFTFMDLVDDNVVDENPDAELISDKSREEAGESPPITTPEGENPPSEGNTREMIDGGTTPEPMPDVPEPADAVQLPRPAPQTEPEAPAEPASPPAAEDGPTSEAEAETPSDDQVVEPEPEPVESELTEAPDTPAQPPLGAAPQPQPGPGGVEAGDDDGQNQRRRDSRQERLSKSLQDMALPTDLQALTPPDAADMPSQSAGRSTLWQFDNDDPSMPWKVGNLSFDSKGADFGPWLREFHRRVLNEWHNNLEDWSDEIWRTISRSQFISDQEKVMRHRYQMSRLRGVTGVDFVVTREGSVVSLTIIHRSGHDGLDRSVQRTLRNVILPPLPDDYPDEQLPIRAGFYFNVEPPQ